MLLGAGALHARLTLPFEFAVAVKFVTALKYATTVGAVGGGANVTKGASATGEVTTVTGRIVVVVVAGTVVVVAEIEPLGEVVVVEFLGKVVVVRTGSSGCKVGRPNFGAVVLTRTVVGGAVTRVVGGALFELATVVVVDLRGAVVGDAFDLEVAARTDGGGGAIVVGGAVTRTFLGGAVTRVVGGAVTRVVGGAVTRTFLGSAVVVVVVARTDVVGTTAATRTFVGAAVEEVAEVEVVDRRDTTVEEVEVVDRRDTTVEEVELVDRGTLVGVAATNPLRNSPISTRSVASCVPELATAGLTMSPEIIATAERATLNFIWCCFLESSFLTLVAIGYFYFKR